MSKELILFIKRLTIYALSILALSFLFAHFIEGRFLTPAMPYLLIFFYLVTFAVFYVLNKFSSKKFSRFVTAFMLATFIKLMLYLGILLIYIFLINKKDAMPFIGAFFVYYLLFTIFETIYIIASSKSSNYK